MALTSVVDGHAHTLQLDYGNGEMASGTTSYGNSAPKNGNTYGTGHSHAWILGENGEVIIAESDGHTHEVAAMSKRAPTADELKKLSESGAAMADGAFPIVVKANLETALQVLGGAKNTAAVARHIKSRAKALGLTSMLPEEGALADLLGKSTDPAGGDEGGHMPDTSTAAAGNEQAELKKKLEETEKQRVELAKRLETAEALASFSDAERTHYGKQDDAGKAAFLKAKPEERRAAIEKASEANPVVYKALDGSEFRKGDDPRLIAMAKSRDEDRREVMRLGMEKREGDFRKRAEDELPLFSGDVGERAALLKAVDGIQDETMRGKVLEVLKGANEGLKPLTNTRGTTQGLRVVAGGTYGKLEALAKAHAAKNNLPLEKSMSAVLDTSEGAELYGQYMAEQRQAQVAAG